MSRVLGVDPGHAHSGWALLDGGALMGRGHFDVDGTLPWAARLPRIRGHFAALLEELRPDLVAIESTKTISGKGHSAAAVHSHAARTRNTEELAGEIREMAARLGADVVRVGEQAGKKALGLSGNGKASDRMVRDAFARMFPDAPPMLVGNHHEARAAGVAMRGAKDWKIAQAGRSRR